ncbi:MAG: fibronectin type III domain-containing protein, partial [Spirochaetaceae bacterium]|nr:fibronectin type III domain-containing protein [Spirochaetaceae bacterium]
APRIFARPPGPPGGGGGEKNKEKRAVPISHLRTLKFTFTLTALFFHGAFAFAENSGVSLRRLEWEEVDGVLQYEVRVETREENQWQQILRQTVRDQLYIDCELKSGDYRFCVRSFDIIGRPGGVSDWIEFSVAQQEAEKSAVAETKDAPSVDDAQNAAVDTVQIVPPIQVQFSGSVDVSKAIWRVSVAAAPYTALPVGTFNRYYTDTIFQPIGFLFSVEAMLFRTKAASFGVQFLPSWNFFTMEKFDTIRSTHIVGLNAAFVAQIKILPASVLNIRAGGGYILFFSRQTVMAESDTVQKAAFNPALLAGVNLRTFFTNALFLDIGADYIHCVASDDASVSFARPFLALGWWF